MGYVDCNSPESQACLDELIKQINDDLTIGCQLPFTVPKKELARIIDRAKDWFYKVYEDSVEEMYIAVCLAGMAKANLSRWYLLAECGG